MAKLISDRMFHHAKELLSSEFDNVIEEFHHKDVFGYTFNGSSCEIEIKLNDYDFYKEFSKECKVFKHQNYLQNPLICPTRFYFFVPRSFMQRALRKMATSPWHNKYGLIIYDYYMDAYKIVKKSEILSSKPFIGEVLDIPYREFKHKRVMA